MSTPEDRMDRMDDHINSVDRRVYVLEGKNMRGAVESRRGN